MLTIKYIEISFRFTKACGNDIELLKQSNSTDFGDACFKIKYFYLK